MREHHTVPLACPRRPALKGSSICRLLEWLGQENVRSLYSEVAQRNSQNSKGKGKAVTGITECLGPSLTRIMLIGPGITS